MNRWLLTLGGACVFGAGYWLGAEKAPVDQNSSANPDVRHSAYEDNEQQRVGRTQEDTSQLSPAEPVENPFKETRSLQQNSIAELPSESDVAAEIQGQPDQALADKPQEYQHQDERKAFNRAFSEKIQDVEKETQVKDFFFLHDQSANIELHKVLCATDKCQVIGMYTGEHKAWDQVVEDLRQAEWWDFTGTSSSSSTRDGVTYFNIFFDKQN